MIRKFLGIGSAVFAASVIALGFASRVSPQYFNPVIIRDYLNPGNAAAVDATHHLLVAVSGGTSGVSPLPLPITAVASTSPIPISAPSNVPVTVQNPPATVSPELAPLSVQAGASAEPTGGPGWRAIVSNKGRTSVHIFNAGGGSPAYCNGDSPVDADATSIKVAVAAATTTPLIGANQNLMVCGYTLQIVSGTSPTFKLAYSGTSNCASTTDLMGPMTGTGLYSNWGGGVNLFPVLTGVELCLITGGTTPVVNGWVTTTSFIGSNAAP